MSDDITNARRYPQDDGSDPGNDVHPPVHRLSEYLDAPSELSVAEREAIEGHLASCQDCQAALTDLRLMVSALGSLPEREAPRSFALTPALLEPVKTPEVARPIVLQESAQWHARHAPKIRWATSIAAILFVFVISADLVTNGLRGGGLGTDDSEDISALVRDGEQADEMSAAQAQDAPDPVPTAAIAADADDAEPAQESAPPADLPESADAPASDDAQDEPETDAALRATGDEDDAGDDDAAILSMENQQISDEPESRVSATSDSSQMRWRVVEVSLALVLALLLAVMIGLPKQRGARRN